MFGVFAIGTSSTVTAAIETVGLAAVGYASVFLGALTLQSDVDHNPAIEAQRIAERVAALDASKIAYDYNSSNNFYYVTYTKMNSEGFVYVGRSSGTPDPYTVVKNRDYNHHIGSDYGKAILSTSARATVPGGYFSRWSDPAYWYIRGAEQSQIEYYRKLGISGNSINGISPANEHLWKYLSNFLNY
jgi:hypothetical protein